MVCLILYNIIHVALLNSAHCTPEAHSGLLCHPLIFPFVMAPVSTFAQLSINGSQTSNVPISIPHALVFDEVRFEGGYVSSSAYVAYVEVSFHRHRSCPSPNVDYCISTALCHPDIRVTAGALQRITEVSGHPVKVIVDPTAAAIPVCVNGMMRGVWKIRFEDRNQRSTPYFDCNMCVKDCTQRLQFPTGLVNIDTLQLRRRPSDPTLFVTVGDAFITSMYNHDASFAGAVDSYRQTALADMAGVEIISGNSA